MSRSEHATSYADDDAQAAAEVRAETEAAELDLAKENAQAAARTHALRATFTALTARAGLEDAEEGAADEARLAGVAVESAVAAEVDVRAQARVRADERGQAAVVKADARKVARQERRAARAPRA